jgi:drug/metabolite transporter (DMT)-like permease
MGRKSAQLNFTWLDACTHYYIVIFINRQYHTTTKWVGTAAITLGVGILFWQEFSINGQLSLGHLTMAAAALY